MLLRTARTTLALAILLLGSCAKEQKPQPPFQPRATLEEVMHHMVIPSAQIVWGAAGTIASKEGIKEIKPETEDDWIDVEAAATTLMEAGNLLMMEGRAKDSKKWFELCRGLIDSADAARKAAQAHDVDALFTRGGDLFEACQACHFTYRFKDDPNTIRTH